MRCPQERVEVGHWERETDRQTERQTTRQTETEFSGGKRETNVAKKWPKERKEGRVKQITALKNLGFHRTHFKKLSKQA